MINRSNNAEILELNGILQENNESPEIPVDPGGPSCRRRWAGSYLGAGH